MNILIPMAGPDTAFKDKGYPHSKNFVELRGRPLIQHVYENLRKIPHSRFTFVILKEEARRFHLGDVLKLLDPDAKIVVAEGLTAGAACTALLGIESIDRDKELLIANGDQILNVDMAAGIETFRQGNCDAGTIVFDSVHPRWSYVRVDDQGRVLEAAEKRPISRWATAGVYYFRRGGDFVESAMSMIRKNASINDAFFICPAFNEMILHQAVIGTWRIARDDYFSLATPQGVEQYERYLNQQAALPPPPDAPEANPE